MKQLQFVLLFFAFSFVLAAQKDESKEYAKMKAELSEKIFSAADPYFKTTTVPEKYKDESIIVLAQKHSLESDSKFKFRIGLFASSGVKYSFFDIFRRKLLINDQSALEEYSQLSFTKLQSKDRGILGKEKNYTFINIRIIKPNGSIKTVDIDESSVVLKDEKDEKQNKIAIPDLSVGDIIDYYVAAYYQEGSVMAGASTPLLYVLGDDYPILNYVISLQFDSRIAVEYQCINGAPDFKISPDEDGGGNVLNMAVKDIPKIKGLIWSSVVRQLPIIRLNYRMGSISRLSMPWIKQGKVERATKGYAEEAEENMTLFVSAACENGAHATKAYKSERSDAKDAWKNYITQHPKADHPDSVAAFIFRYLSWKYFFENFSENTNYNNAYFTVSLPNQIDLIALFANIMKLEFKTDVDLVLLSGKDSYTRENIFSPRDLSLLVRVNEPKPKYFSFADNLDFGNTIPYELQGEKAKIFPFETRSLIGGKILYISSKGSSTVTLPASDYKTNFKKDLITVATDASDIQLLNITRKASANGQLKKDEQASLTIFEEMALQTGHAAGYPDDLIQKNKERNKSARINENDLKDLLEKARTKHKEDFENEIQRNYDIKAKELKRYKILDFGIYPLSPFEYEEDFIMEGLVKKAGSNYIVDIGKLISSQLVIEKDQRERSKDIYMPFPRSFSYQIEFMIPEGYTAEGLEKLTTNTENETGGFLASAKQEGNKVILTINKYYVHFFEPSEKWPLMLNFLDKAIDYSQQKLLLKKI